MDKFWICLYSTLEILSLDFAFKTKEISLMYNYRTLLKWWKNKQNEIRRIDNVNTHPDFVTARMEALWRFMAH